MSHCFFLNTDEEHVKRITTKLEENGGYCPCSLIQNEDTKCPCKEFRESKKEWCTCKLYRKEIN